MMQATEQSAPRPSTKVYVCETCRTVYDTARTRCATPRCLGPVRAAHRCPSCDCWAWAVQVSDDLIEYVCRHDCAARGVAPRRYAMV